MFCLYRPKIRNDGVESDNSDNPVELQHRVYTETGGGEAKPRTCATALHWYLGEANKSIVTCVLACLSLMGEYLSIL